MTQNIYDNDDFFAEYSRLGRSVHGLQGAMEWSALQSLLPNLNEQNVLDLGCGYGWFCRWAREQGAVDVRGVDISEKMLARATEMTSDPAITYTRTNLETLKLPSDTFHLVYSSLAFHYLENMNPLLAQIYQALIPGGSLVFSVEHPIYTAPTQPDWSINAAGDRSWLLDNYLTEGPRSTDWLAKGVIKQHRTLATYINNLLAIGFSLTHIEEWGPTEAQIAAEPARIEDRHRPAFLLIAATRC